MTDQEINGAIAEACGVQKITTKTGGFVAFAIQDGDTDHWSRTPPDYCNDLNAISGAINSLDANQRLNFLVQLDNVTTRSKPCDWYPLRVINASARQRAEAFLKTLGKWRSE